MHHFWYAFNIGVNFELLYTQVTNAIAFKFMLPIYH